MKKITKISFTIIYGLFSYIYLSDAYNFLVNEGKNYPQIGRTHTFNEYLFENIIFGVFCILGITLLWNKSIHKNILYVYFMLFVVYILVSTYKSYNYW